MKTKKYLSLVLAFAIPALAACGSAEASAETGPNPEAAVVAENAGSSATAEPRWSPPTDAESAAEQNQPAVAAEPTTVADAEAKEDQAFPPVGVSDKEVLAVLGKPSRSELGQNSRHLYSNFLYKDILFPSVEVDMMSDGTVWLINFEADSSTDIETVKAFTEDWANAVAESYGTPGVSHTDGPVLSRTSYSWLDYMLTLDEYADGKFVIGFFYQNPQYWETH